jgi:hypothetical protein
MDFFLKVLLVPIVIGLVRLVLEYCIFQPLRERLIQRNASNTGSNSQSIRRINILALALIFLLISAIVSVAFSLAIIFSSYGLPNQSTKVLEGLRNIYSDANVSFSLILYTLTALNIISFNLGTSWNRYFSSAVLPFLSILIWVIVYFRTNWFVLFFFVLACNVIISIGTFFLERTYRGDSPNQYLSARDIQATLWLFCLLFPSNALLLINIGEYPHFMGWFCSFLFVGFSSCSVNCIRDAY